MNVERNQQLNSTESVDVELVKMTGGVDSADDNFVGVAEQIVKEPTEEERRMAL